MRILFVGDIVSKAGKAILLASLKKLEGTYDFLIVNGENITGGKGISKSDYQELLDNGVNCITLGNHWHGQYDLDRWIDDAKCLVRPLNLIGYYHGSGSRLFDVNGTLIRVTNILGSAFMKEAVNFPHLAILNLYQRIEPSIHIIDYHGEATSEKQIFMLNNAGKVTAILGTHTHIQTADERIVNGTAIQTDVGMCGILNGSIGATFESAKERFVEGKNTPLDYEGVGLSQFNATLIEVDEKSREAVSVRRIHLEEIIDE